MSLGPFRASKTLVLSRAVPLEVEAQAGRAVARVSGGSCGPVACLRGGLVLQMPALAELPACSSCFLPARVAISMCGDCC